MTDSVDLIKADHFTKTATAETEGSGAGIQTSVHMDKLPTYFGLSQRVKIHD